MRSDSVVARAGGSRALMLAACLVAVLPGCASVMAERARTDALVKALATAECPTSVDDAWDEARRMLAALSFPLIGKDADAVGQPSNLLQRIFSPARETRSEPHGGRSLDTGWKRNLRYHLDYSPDIHGCHIAFWEIHEDKTEINRDSSDGPRRDLDMELDLVRRLAPSEADRIEGLVPAK